MLGLLLLYIIGRVFYELAVKYGKNKWAFGALGIVAYYAGTFIGGIAAVLLLELFGSTLIDDLSDREAGLIALPFGLLGCWAFYVYLKKQWARQTMETEADILDDEFLK